MAGRRRRTDVRLSVQVERRDASSPGRCVSKLGKREDGRDGMRLFRDAEEV